jgi:hypothetical protein
MNSDFTLQKYSQLCRSILESEYTVYTVAEYIDHQNEADLCIVLKHDVDRKPKNAIKMASLEKKYNIRSTYYFRMTRGSFNAEIIKKLTEMGHEIGYHYETLAKVKGDPYKAFQLFCHELEQFKKLYDVKTSCMHGLPYSKYDNQEMWEYVEFNKTGLIGDALLSVDYSQILYVSDTGRTWHPLKHKIRDKVNGLIDPGVRSTDQLIKTILKKKYNRLLINAHPERWSRNRSEFLFQWFIDKIINFIKLFLTII